MKKKLTLSVIALLVLLASVFAFTACTIESEGYWESKADSKNDSIELLNGFFENTLKESDMVITLKSGGEIQVTENIKGSSSCYVGKDGTKVTSYIKDTYYYYVIESEDTNTYFTNDSSKRGYDADASSYYNLNRFYFMSNVKIVEMIPETAGTFTCTSRVDEKNGSTTGTLTFDFVSENGTVKITAAAKDELVQTFSVEKQGLVESEQSVSVTATIVYGGATVTLPDTDAWDAEEEARETEEAAKQARIEANETAMGDFYDFFSDTLCEENVVVTVMSGETLVFTETIADGIDYVDNDTYKTYAYEEVIDEDNSDLYCVFDGFMKIYKVNSEEYYDIILVYFNNILQSIEQVGCAEDVEYICTVQDNVLTFEVEGEVENLTITVTKSGDTVANVSVVQGSSTMTYTFEYGTGVVEKPDLTDFIEIPASEDDNIEEE